MVNFLKDPTGDMPWEEDPVGKDVHHVNDMPVSDSFISLLYISLLLYCNSVIIRLVLYRNIF